VCGFGRVGRQVAQELAYEGVNFVIIDRNPKIVKEAMDKKFNAIEGDPIKESVLARAGIKDAKSLISALGEDTDNLFLTLTARSLNKDIFIVSRASSQENVNKLKKAGADKVSMPYQIGGYHMAGIALRPAVVDFLDVISDGRHAELQIEELNIERGSTLIGQRIAETLSRKKAGVTVLAVNKANGTTRINPSGEEMIERDDQLILMGTKDQLEKLSKEIAT
ncbi:MAG: NAD-binding protein, partial [Patescibacteria group bacterium]|nr:NAD-binding protein [Patescibacteria group bacterium]